MFPDASVTPDAGLAQEISGAIAVAVCAKIDECCAGEARMRVIGAGEDRAACEENMRAFYGRQYEGAVALIERASSVFDRGALERCQAAYLGAGCSAPAFTAAQACAQVLTGAFMDGAQCESGFECSSRRCPRTTAAVPGMCTPRVADGQPCQRDNECASRLCSTSRLFGVCAARPLPGDSCGGEGFWLTL